MALVPSLANRFLPDQYKPKNLVRDAIYGKEDERKGNITLPPAVGGIMGSQTYAKDGINLPEFGVSEKAGEFLKKFIKKDGVKGIVPGISPNQFSI
tara:strand:- start:782 stop:1069 length:288 start_codon:yes stop_codon:yes gene_type:complete